MPAAIMIAITKPPKISRTRIGYVFLRNNRNDPRSIDVCNTGNSATVAAPAQSIGTFGKLWSPTFYARRHKISLGHLERPYVLQPSRASPLILLFAEGNYVRRMPNISDHFCEG